MARIMTDRINLFVAHLNPRMEMDNPDAVHMVGASRLGDYLLQMCGNESPQDPAKRLRCQAVLGTLAALSTDETYQSILREDDITKMVPHWLRLTTPFFEATGALGRNIAGQLAALESGRFGVTDFIDWAFCIALHDVSSFAVAGELEIPHPRFTNKPLLDRTRTIVPPTQTLQNIPQDAISPFALIANLPSIKREYQRKIRRNIGLGYSIISQAVSNTNLLDSLIKQAWAADED